MCGNPTTAVTAAFPLMEYASLRETQDLHIGISNEDWKPKQKATSKKLVLLFSVAAVASCGIVLLVAFSGNSTSGNSELDKSVKNLALLRELEKNRIGDGCELTCYHGGHPNESCESCDNCAGAWTGKQCTEWDESVAKDVLLAEIGALVQESKSDLDKLKELHPVPGTIGLGVDITTGDVKLPVVALTYKPDSAAKTWTDSKGNTFIVPDESKFTDYQSTGLYNPTRATYVFQNEAAFAKHLSSCLSEPCGGAMSVIEMLTNAKHAGGSLALSQQYYPVYNMELPVDPDTKRHEYNLHRSAKRAIEALPPTDDGEYKNVYQEFIANWGTSFTTSSENGGLMEYGTFVEYALWTTETTSKNPYSEEEIRSDAAVSFSLKLKESQKAPSQDYTFANKGEVLRWRGGSAAEAVTVDTIDQWVDTIEDAPVPIKFSATAISDLVRDLDLRSGLQRAVHTYVREKMKERVLNSCPAGWGGDRCLKPLCDGVPAGVGCMLGSCQAIPAENFRHQCQRNCQWQCGEPGQFMQCPATSPVSLAQGQCGGGMDHDCTQHCTGNGAIECCSGEAPLTVAATPQWKCSNKGEYAFCNKDEGSVIGECESGKENDCGAYRHPAGDGSPCAGSSAHSAILCGGITNVDMDKCAWRCHFKGDFVECPEGQVLMGKCGGGKEHDCNAGPCAGTDTYHASMCCPILAV